MPNSTVSQMKKTIKEIDPPFFTERRGEGPAPIAMYKQANDQQPKLGKFVPAHLPGDSYVDQAKRKNIERVMEAHKNFSHRAFVMGNRPTEHEHHGGWEGCFAQMHGGFPHMFENLAPNKTRQWLGTKGTQPVQAMPMLVKFPSKSGPGFPQRTLGEEYPYHSEMNHEAVEKANQRLRLGLGGASAEGERPGKARSRGEGGARAGALAAQLAARAEHSAPFISAAPERKLPADLFGRYGYMEEDFVDNVHKRFEATAQEEVERRNRKLGVTALKHPPFKSAGPSILTRATPSVMFRRSGR